MSTHSHTGVALLGLKSSTAMHEEKVAFARICVDKNEANTFTVQYLLEAENIYFLLLNFC